LPKDLYSFVALKIKSLFLDLLNDSNDKDKDKIFDLDEKKELHEICYFKCKENFI
jgi:hypothetical protein